MWNNIAKLSKVISLLVTNTAPDFGAMKQLIECVGGRWLFAPFPIRSQFFVCSDKRQDNATPPSYTIRPKIPREAGWEVKVGTPNGRQRKI